MQTKNITNIVVYFFSGTGNSRNVAYWISQFAFDRNITIQLLNIAQVNRRKIEAPPADSLIFFISPVHGFNYPPVMLHFIMCFPLGNNDVVLMNTRAGMKIGNFITPGLSGITFYLASLILKIKGYAIKSWYPIDLPSNWISIHPGLNNNTITFLHLKNKEKVLNYLEALLSGKRNYKAVREIIQDILVSPIAMLYYFAGRFFLAKTYYASRDCNGCDLCIRSCPVKAIKKVDKRPYWTFNCESCMKCMGNCPTKAIETGHGFVLGYIVLYSILVGLFINLFSQFFFEFKNPLITFVVQTGLSLFLLFICHGIMHYALKIKIIERIMVYTSLTKFKFWGRRYKALKP